MYIINNRFFYIEIINDTDFKFIIKNKKVIDEHIDLYYNNNIIPYSKTNDYYLLSTTTNNYYGKITVNDNYSLKVKKYNKSKNELIENNDSVELLVYDDNNYKVLKIKLTSFPVLSINNNDLVVYDNSKIDNYKCEHHVRGGQSVHYAKVSYKLNIKNNNLESKNVSLLNMRYEDDWILNPMFVDNSYIREKIGYELWNSMSNYDINTRYVELFIDNEYIGLYLLTEQVNTKTFNTNKESDIISTKKWNNEVTNDILYNENLPELEYVNEFEFTTNNNSFDVRLDLLRKLYSDIYDKEYKSSNKITYNYDNITEYSILINMIQAMDNFYKNEKVLFKKISSNTYEINKCPWDLDWSIDNERVPEYDNSTILTDTLLPESILNSNEYISTLKSNYFKVAKNYYNEEYINSLIDKYISILEQSGSVKRNNENYGYDTKPFYESIEIVREFFKNRIKLLDEYYGGL